MDDPLLVFVRARLDEREQRAREWTEAEQPHEEHAPGECPTCDRRRRLIVNLLDHEDVDEPEFVLADVAAKRRIIDEHQDNGVGSCGTCVDWMNDHLKWPCRTVRLLALPFAGHPDFREEWRA